MSTRSKGNYYEKRSITYLEKKGYVCEKANAKVIWIHGRPICKAHDFFGIVDIIAVSDNDIQFVQVKFIGENTSRSMKEIKDKFSQIPYPKCLKKLIHIWHKGDKEPTIIDAAE